MSVGWRLQGDKGFRQRDLLPGGKGCGKIIVNHAPLIPTMTLDSIPKHRLAEPHVTHSWPHEKLC